MDTIDLYHDGVDFLPEMPTASNRVALVQALARRLSTRKGAWPWWPTYGLYLPDYLMSKTSPNVISSAVRGEILQDERVVECRVNATVEAGGITIQAAVLDETGVDYAFTLSVTEAGVELL